MLRLAWCGLRCQGLEAPGLLSLCNATSAIPCPVTRLSATAIGRRAGRADPPLRIDAIRARLGAKKCGLGKSSGIIVVLIAAYGGGVRAQSPPTPPQSEPQKPPSQKPMPGMDMPATGTPEAPMPEMNSTAMYSMERTSGTGANPESAAMKMFSWKVQANGRI